VERVLVLVLVCSTRSSGRRSDCLLGQLLLFVEFPEGGCPHVARLENPIVIDQRFAGLAGGGTPVLHYGMVEVGLAIRAQREAGAVRVGHLADLSDGFVLDRFDIRTNLGDLALEEVEQFLVRVHAVVFLRNTDAEIDVSVVQVDATGLAGGRTQLDDVCTGHHLAVLDRVPVSVAVQYNGDCCVSKRSGTRWLA
jgi:hypothetical protein